VFHWDANDKSIDGGAGTNTLLAVGGDIDFSAPSHPTVSNIQQIDLGTGGHTLTLTAADVLNMTDATTHSLTVLGDGSDAVVADNNWVDVGVSGGNHIYTHDMGGGVTVTLAVDSTITSVTIGTP